MNALSRREEDTLMKAMKARALKECDPVVKGTRIFLLPSVFTVFNKLFLAFAECATGRTVSVAWACRGQLRSVQECMVQ